MHIQEWSDSMNTGEGIQNGLEPTVALEIANEAVKREKRGKPKTRGNGQGSKLRQLPSGSWRWEIRLDGQYFSGTKPTKSEAEKERARVITDHDRGVLASADQTTLAEYAKKWLERQKQIRTNTKRMYEMELGYILKHLGAKKLRDLRPKGIKDALEKLATEEMSKGSGRIMSNRTLGMVRTRLKAVFTEAVHDQILYVNPVDAVKPVKSGVDSSETGGMALDFEQAAMLNELGEALYGAGLCRLWPALFTGLSLGLRRGEIMGLRWCDLDFDNNVLKIRQNLTGTNTPFISTPKTKGSIRDLPIPASLRALLERHRTTQTLDKAKAGECWVDSGAVFTTEIGTYTHPRNLDRALKGVLNWSEPGAIERRERRREGDADHVKGKPKKRLMTLEQRLLSVPVKHRAAIIAIMGAGKPLPRISPHDLRHTAGTLMLRRGVPIEVVSKLLGHANISITLNVYRHVGDDEIRARAIDLFPIPSRVVNEPPQTNLNGS
jgi:integrase